MAGTGLKTKISKGLLVGKQNIEVFSDGCCCVIVPFSCSCDVLPVSIWMSVIALFDAAPSWYAN